VIDYRLNNEHFMVKKSIQGSWTVVDFNMQERLFFKIYFVLKYIKIIFFYFLILIYKIIEKNLK